MSTIPANLRYSMDSIRAIEEIRSRFGNILRDRAAWKTSCEGRELVTEDDVLACATLALRDTLKTLGCG